MRKATRSLAVLATLAVAIVGMDSCGGSAGEVVVARLSGVGAITKAMLDHWIQIEAVLLYQESPSKPVPRGVMPDPPAYPACIAFLGTTRQKIAESGPKPTAKELKRKCAQKYQYLKELALNTLINWHWTLGNGAAVGMKVSDAEVDKRIAAIKAVSFPKPKEFDKYLRLTKETADDMRFRAKVQLVEVKFQEKLSGFRKSLPKSVTAQQQQAAFAKLAQSWPTPKQWALKTSCRKGYVTSDCRQYHGPLPTGTPN